MQVPSLDEVAPGDLKFDTSSSRSLFLVMLALMLAFSVLTSSPYAYGPCTQSFRHGLAVRCCYFPLILCRLQIGGCRQHINGT